MKTRKKLMNLENLKMIDRILNIVAFCVLIESNDGILGKSPDYVTKKFKKYCLSEDAEEWKRGLDPVGLKIINDWTIKWFNWIIQTKVEKKLK